MTKLLAPIALLVCCALAGPASAAGASPCGDAVVRDWTTDGRIDRKYAPRCYGDAVDALPEDVRSYTTAADDMYLAMRERLRELRARPSTVTRDSGEGGTTVPVPLVSGAAFAAVVALAGLAALVLRTLRRLRPARPARPLGHW